MNPLRLDPADGGGRFPGFDVLSQSEHWDRATEAVVAARLGLHPDIRFFTPGEEATASALVDQLLYQREEPKIPIVNMIDTRLAEQRTDGWHYEGLPPDGQAWRETLKALDDDASIAGAESFADCSWEEQARILELIYGLKDHLWHGYVAKRVWSLWTRYACTAFYSHPWAWNEIGFAGPAYPRGYKNLGVNALEPFEVRDVRPDDDPAARDDS